MSIVETRDGGFRTLFNYIQGSNVQKQQISMTTPVFMQQNENANKMMSFVMPASMSLEQVPLP